MPKRPQRPTHSRTRHPPPRDGQPRAHTTPGTRRHARSASPAARPREPHAGETHSREPPAPGEDPGTLTDEDYLSAGGPDAIDSATDE